MATVTIKQQLLLPLLLTVMLVSCGGGKPPTYSIEVAAVGAQGGSFSGNGDLGVVGSVHHGGSLWRIKDGARLYNWNHYEGEYTSVVAADFSPDGQWALTADSHTLVLWETKGGTALRFWTAPGEVLAIALSAEGNYALLGLADNTAVVFDVKRGGVKRTFHHRGRVHAVDLSNDGRLALTGSEDHTAILWDMNTAQALHRVAHQEPVQLALLSANGKRAFTSAKYDRSVIWKTDSGEIIGALPLPPEKIKRGVRYTAAKFSPEGGFLLTGLPDRTVQLWDASNLTEVGRWELPKRDPWKPTSASVLALTFSDHTNRFYALASNGFVHQLDLGG